MIINISGVPKSDLGQVPLNTKMSQSTQIDRAHVYLTDTNV